MKAACLVATALAFVVSGCGHRSGAPVPGPAAEADLVARARAIHARVLTLDTHVDINPANFRLQRPNYADSIATQVNLPKMLAGGLDAVFFSIYVAQGPQTAAGYAAAFATQKEKFDAVHRLTKEIAPGRIGIARTSDDVRRIAATGRKVALMGVENAYGIGTDIGNLRRFYDRGARYMSLAHNGHSQLSDSNTGERDGVWQWNGLSPLGRSVVHEMNRLGMMIDISHPSKAANMQMMALSQAPVIASHSAVRALCNHSRNLDDEELRAMARGGGVVQVVAFSNYLRCSAPSPAGGPRPPRATVRDLVDHIDYAVKLIGIDHVGISSDFDGGGGVEGWSDAAETPNVTTELVRRGYTETQIAALWSGNLLRVMSAVEKVAARN